MLKQHARVCHLHWIERWERVCLTEEPEGLAAERRDRRRKRRLKLLPKEAEPDLLAAVPKLRA